MIASIKSEFRKVLSIRSTYILIIICLVLMGLFAFYGQGIRYADGFKGPGLPPVPPDYLQRAVADAVNALALFIALIGVLLMTHEYRYNTVMYTLTASNSRTKTLLSKVFVISAVSIALTLIMGTLSPLVTALGLHIRGAELGTQVFYFKDLLWHVLLYGWGFAMAGLLLAVLIRNQIGAIVALLLIPTTVEPLLSFVLGEKNSHYLPFLSLGAVINHNPTMSEARGAVVFLAYLVIGWAVGWILFVRRDAN
jgi:ABC-2 type transport system permease protein